MIPRNYAAFPSRLEDQQFIICPKYKRKHTTRRNLVHLWLWIAQAWKISHWGGKAPRRFQQTTDEIVFNSDYYITGFSKTTRLDNKAICPSCSQRDVKSNPFVVSEYLGLLPDPVGLASRCNGGIGTATSSGTSSSHQQQHQQTTAFAPILAA